MSFSTENSARRIVQKSPSWKSRSLNLGNRHRTTLNFGDLVPAYWQFAQPGDKFKMDASILAKFMPLIAPAFSRMKIKTEWFYVPLRQISPPSLRALQDFTPEPQDVSSYFSQLLSGFRRTQTKTSDDQQVRLLSGFPTIPAYVLNAWLCGDTATILQPASSPSNYVILGSDYSPSKWRTPSAGVSASDYSSIGLESLTTYTSKFRAAKFMSYLGLPSRLTTMRFTTDAMLPWDVNPSDYTVDDLGVAHFNGTDVVSSAGSTVFEPYVSSRYLSLAHVNWRNFTNFNVTFSVSRSQTAINVPSWDFRAYGYATTFGMVVNNSASSYQLDKTLLTGARYSNADTEDPSDVVYDYEFPSLTTASNAPITLLPMQAYQKIYNDFYRDEKLQDEEIRFYPYAVTENDGKAICLADKDAERIADFHFPASVVNNNQDKNAESSWSASNNKFLNNLFGLRRRNRAKDVISSCVTSQVVLGQLSQGENETVYNANLYSKLAKFFMKKEFTGSTWAEWLNNFFGVNSNDYLNNNVIFLGGRESTVAISENIQNSESTESSAQGNRAGLAGDFHNGNEIYFRSPDFGVIMCIVSVIPDDIDNFNGLQERFQRSSVFDFNLPDLQNIGFSPVPNSRVNIGMFERHNDLYPYDFFPTDKAASNGVFGYQPFGYSHTYTPDVISGDFQKSLRFWHQSPDLDFDFTKNQDVGNVNSLDYVSWANNQLALNGNLPAIGLRMQPLGHDLKAQYYNNVFAVTNDESGDHIVADMRFAVTCHRNTAFFTDAVEDEK